MPKDDETSVEQEIAALKEKNEALSKDNQRYHHLLSNAPIMTYGFEARGDFSPTFISENIKKIIGYDSEEYLADNKFTSRRVHPDDAKRVQGEVTKLFEIGHLVIEYRLLCKDDTYRWVSDEMQLLRDESGKPLEVVGSWHDITEQRKSSEKLATAEGRLSHILGASPAVVYSFEGKGNFRPTFISDNLKEVFGYEPSEYLEDPKFMPSHIHPEDHARMEKMWSQLFRTGKHTNEYRFKRADGKYRWVSDELRLLRDEEGVPLEIVGAMHDVTERKKEEEEILKLKNRFKHLLTSAPAVTYCFEAKGNYLPTFVSENIKDLLGYEPKEYLNDRSFVPNHIHPDDAQRVQNDLSHLFRDGYLVHEYRFLCKDGHYCWVNDELHVLTDDHGEPLEVVGSWSDITARRKMGEAMVAAQDRLNHLLTSAPAVLYSFKASGNYLPTFISENVKALLGYEPKEFFEDEDFWTNHIHPNDLPRVQRNLKPLNEEGELTHEYRFLHKKGHYCWVNEELHLLRNKEGEATEIVGSMNDVSARKKIEKELAIAKEQAEFANRAKSDFLAKMSHELRTPLNAIIGITEMLIEDVKDNDINAFDEPLTRVHGAGKHLLNLINELLDISKIEAGIIDLHIETFNIEDLINDVTATIKPMLDANHDTLEVNNLTEKEDIQSDKKRIVQILLNLLSNAAKFTENGSVTLKVKSSNEDNSEYILFDVIDTGMGIPKDKIEDMFSEYVQIGSSKASKFASTGLGLSISRKLARIMGGDITAKSKYGEGSTFTVKLPIDVKVK